MMLYEFENKTITVIKLETSNDINLMDLDYCMTLLPQNVKHNTIDPNVLLGLRVMVSIMRYYYRNTDIKRLIPMANVGEDFLLSMASYFSKKVELADMSVLDIIRRNPKFINKYFSMIRELSGAYNSTMKPVMLHTYIEDNVKYQSMIIAGTFLEVSKDKHERFNEVALDYIMDMYTYV